MRYFIFSNDVELTSIQNNKQSTDAGRLISEKGMPALLDLYAKHDVKTTFFVTCDYARLFPDSVRQIKKAGHTVGSHGLAHGHDDALDTLAYEQQYKALKESKSILEDITGEPVISFRAPALRVNKHTPQALIDCGYLIDSSIASQRFDFFMTFGTMSKLKWLRAPRKPYFCSPHDLSQKGNSNLLEIPMISLIYPYIGSTLRMFPSITSIVRQLLFLESKLFNTCIVFLVHPNEFIDEVTDSDSLSRRSKHLIQYVLAERLRTYLKRKNLGVASLQLLENEIKVCKSNGFKTISMEDFYYMMIKEMGNG